MQIRLILFFAASVLLTSESMFHWILPIPVVTAIGEDSVVGKIIVKADGLNEPLCQRGLNHKDLSLSDFSPYLKQAVIASEDSRFDWHLGSDPIGIVGAATKLLQKDTRRGGASTITQQVARTVFGVRVGGDENLKDKIIEFLYAHLIELFYSKDDILKLYLNRVYLGHLEKVNIGFEAASKSYFGKSAVFLDVQEAASLVSILPSPNNYKYYGDNTSAKNEKGEDVFKADRVAARRNSIIEKMAYLGFIDNVAKSKAQESTLNIFNNVVTPAYSQNSKVVSQHFCEYIITNELPKYQNDKIMTSRRLIIETTLNIKAQKEAEASLANFVDYKGKKYGYPQASILSLKLNSGEITTMVGGMDAINRTTMSYFQPGSTFKIFTYITALKQRIPLSQKLSCDSLTWGLTYKPCHYSVNTSEINLKDGLILSENVISLRLAQKVGLKKIIETADDLGIKFRDVLPPENQIKLQRKIETINTEYDAKYLELENRISKAQLEIDENTIETRIDRLKANKNKIEIEKHRLEEKKNKDIKIEQKKLETPYTKLDEGFLSPGLVLGQTEVRLFDIIPVYAMIGNNGIRNDPHGIKKIRDARKCNVPQNTDTCEVLYNSVSKAQNPNSSKQKIPLNIANELDDVLRDVVLKGTGKQAYFEGSQAAGKTGTTNEGKDLWFIGYSHSKCMATGIWVGNDKNDSEVKTRGTSELAAQLWKNYMKELPTKKKC